MGLRAGLDSKYHEMTNDKCPFCGRLMVRVKQTGFKFCSDIPTIYGCDYEDESECQKRKENEDG